MQHKCTHKYKFAFKKIMSENDTIQFNSIHAVTVADLDWMFN